MKTVSKALLKVSITKVMSVGKTKSATPKKQKTTNKSRTGTKKFIRNRTTRTFLMGLIYDASYWRKVLASCKPPFALPVDGYLR